MGTGPSALTKTRSSTSGCQETTAAQRLMGSPDRRRSLLTDRRVAMETRDAPIRLSRDVRTRSQIYWLVWFKTDLRVLVFSTRIMSGGLSADTKAETQR